MQTNFEVFTSYTTITKCLHYWITSANCKGEKISSDKTKKPIIFDFGKIELKKFNIWGLLVQQIFDWNFYFNFQFHGVLSIRSFCSLWNLIFLFWSALQEEYTSIWNQVGKFIILLDLHALRLHWFLNEGNPFITL